MKSNLHPMIESDAHDLSSKVHNLADPTNSQGIEVTHERSVSDLY
jgi:hypothetical protein